MTNHHPNSFRDEIVLLAGHEIKNPLTAFNLQNKVLLDLAKKNDLSDCRNQITEIALKNEKQVQRIAMMLDRIIWLVESREI